MPRQTCLPRSNQRNQAMPHCASHRPSSQRYRILLGLAWLALTLAGRADEVIFHLRNGDRITGAIISENSSEVILSTAFAGKITLPVSQIEKREKPPVPAAPTVTKPEQAASKPTSPAPPAKGDEKNTS